MSKEDRRLFTDIANLIRGKSERLDIEHVYDVSKEFISSGSRGLDDLLVGGFQLPSLVEIHGPISSGKTVLALHTLRAAQASGQEGAYIDIEHKLKPDYCQKIGVDISKLTVCEVDHAEATIHAIRELAKDHKVIVLDSLAAICSRKASEGLQTSFAEEAQTRDQVVKVAAGICQESRCTIILLNQIRRDIVRRKNIPSGGWSLRYLAHISICLSKVGTVGRDNEPIGFVSEAEVIKHKWEMITESVRIPFLHTGGIDHAAELLMLALKYGAIDKKNNYYSFTNPAYSNRISELGHGKTTAAKTIRESSEVTDYLLAQILIAQTREKNKRK